RRAGPERRRYRPVLQTLGTQRHQYGLWRTGHVGPRPEHGRTDQHLRIPPASVQPPTLIAKQGLYMTPKNASLTFERIKRASVLLMCCGLLAACGGGSDTGSSGNTGSPEEPTEPGKPTPEPAPQLKCAP